ncbi:MAG: carboxypeptidase regulatory-like domain-containing protein, partial [Isosphaeraceae bacterium]
GDDVTIDVAGASPTVTISSGSQSVHSLTAADPLVLSGGSLALASSSTISGPFTLDGGTLNLNGPNGPLTLAGSTTWTSGQINNQNQTVTNTGSITLNDTLQVNFGSGSYSSGGTLLNQGTIFQTSAGGLSLSNGAAIDNAAGGTYDFASDSGIALGGFGGSFANEGTVEKTAGTAATTIAVPFNNQGGTVAADSGTLSLAGGGTSTGGTYNAASGATIDLADHTQSTLTGTYTGSGAGAVNVGNNALNIGQAGATFDFPPGLFQWSSGNINVATGDTLTNTGSITINDSQQVQLGSGSGYVGGGTLDNQGIIFQTGSGGLSVGEGLVIQNASGGTYKSGADAGIVPGFNNGTFTNQGTVEKTAGTGTSSIGIVFDNQGGTVAADSGTLSLAGGGTSTGGTYNASSGATFDLADGSNQPTLTGTYTGSGAGTVNVGSNALNIGTAGATFDFPAGLFQWSSGNINCNGGNTLTNTGSITVSDAHLVQFGTGSDYVGGGTLLNKGLIIETGSAGLQLGNGATLDNAAGGTYELAGDFGMPAGFNGGSFINAGTLEKTAGTGTSTIAISFANQGGAVLLQSGTLGLTVSNSTSTGGSVTVAAGSLSIAALSSSFTGVRFTVAAGSLSLDGSNCTFTGDTFTVASGATMDPTGGNSDTYAGCTFAGGGTVAFNGSIAIGIGGVTMNVGNFDWSGGSINSALGDLTNLGTMTISGTGEHEFFNDGTIDDRGTIVQTGTGNLGLHSDNQFPTALLIERGASYVIQADSGLDNPVGGQTAVINDGTIEKTAGTGVSRLLVNGTLTNAGVIDVQSGTVQLAANAVTSTGGSFAVAQGAILDPTGGQTVPYSGTFTGSGAGAVLLSSGTIAIGAGGATFDFPAGLLQWPGGSLDLDGNTLTNTGSITIDSAATFGIFANNFFSGGSSGNLGGSLMNRGALIDSGTGSLQLFDSVTLNNAAPGNFNFTGDGGILLGNDSPTISNAGLFEKTAGTNTSAINVPFSNTGTVEAASGTLALASSVAQLAGTTLTGGNWDALNGAALTLPSGTTIATNQASVTLQGAGATLTGLGALAASSGSLSLLAGAGLTTSGALSNSGGLTLGPGSTLTVTGDFTQGSSGSLQFQIGGTPASGGFGQISVTGSAALTGTLDDALVGNFGPAAGTTYQVMTFASQTGRFATVDSPQFHGGAFLQVQTNPGNVTLTASTAVADLAVTSATLQTTTAQPGQAVTVNYQVTDQASATPVSSWVDSIFLTSVTTIDSSAVLLGRVTHTGAVAAGGTYTGTLTVPLPAILPGTYNIIVEVDSRGLVPDANRSNNLMATATTLQTTLPVLDVAAPGTTPTATTGTIASGEEIVFQATLTAGEVVQVAASTGSVSGVELLASFNSIPTEANATAQTFAPGQTQQQLSLTATQSGTYDIVLVGQPGAGNGTSFNLTGQQLPFLLKTVSPSKVGNTGPVTLTITGGELAATDTFTLLAPGGTAISDSAVLAQDGSTIYATFDLTGAALGTYALSATSPTGQVVSLPSALAVQPGQAAVLKAQVQVPSAQRIGRPVSAGLFFQNTGNVDMPAPLFIISNGNNDNLQLSFSGPTGLSTGPQFLMGISPNGPAGILQPGAKLRVPFFEESLVESGESGSDGDPDDATGGGAARQVIQVQFETAASTDPVDYAALSQSLGLAPTDPVMRVIENKAGPTWGGLVTLLDQTATDMKQAGGNAQSAGAVLSDLVENAAFQADGGVSGQVVLAGSSQATAVAGTSVELTTSDGTQTFGGVTAADGSFQITGVPAGTYTMTVSGDVLTGSSTVTIPANGRLSGLQIAVLPGGQIGGSIFNPAGGRLAAVTITAAAEDGSNLAAVTTGPSGTYNLSGLSPGTYDLTATGSGLGTQYLKGLVVGAGTSLVQNITLAAAASVAGTVFANGVSLAGAQAILTDAQGDAVGAVTDANGNYSLTGLGAGTYTLEVSGQGFAPTDTTLTLTAGQTSQAPGIVLAPGASLSLTVTDSSANPITNGTVEVDNASGIVALLATDTNGQVSLSNLAAGTYFVHSFASGFLDTVDTITLPAGASVARTEVIQPAGGISGVVTDASGSPIANEQVTLFGQDTLGREFSSGATTASDGSYKFT